MLHPQYVLNKVCSSVGSDWTLRLILLQRSVLHWIHTCSKLTFSPSNPFSLSGERRTAKNQLFRIYRHFHTKSSIFQRLKIWTIEWETVSWPGWGLISHYFIIRLKSHNKPCWFAMICYNILSKREECTDQLSNTESPDRSQKTSKEDECRIISMGKKNFPTSNRVENMLEEVGNLCQRRQSRDAIMSGNPMFYNKVQTIGYSQEQTAGSLVTGLFSLPRFGQILQNWLDRENGSLWIKIFVIPKQCDVNFPKTPWNEAESLHICHLPTLKPTVLTFRTKLCPSPKHRDLLYDISLAKYILQ